MSSLSCVLFLLTLAAYSGVGDCEKNASASVQREGRQLDLPRDVRLVRYYVDGHKQLRRPPPPPQISPRSDHFPQRLGPGPGPGPFGRPQFGRPPIPHMRRRVYSGPGGPPPPGVFLRSNGPPPPFANFQGMKSGRFPQSKGPYVQKPGPGNFYRQGQSPIIPNLNAIPQGPNFKPSPIYNGEVIVRRPSAAPLVAAPPPESPTAHSHSSKPEEKHDSLRFYKSNAAADSHMYSVYEDTDSDAEESFPPVRNIGESAMKEAKQFLNFMSSNEYFLPKMQPDYRKLDQQQQQQLQESEAAAALSAYQQQQRNAESSAINAAFTVNAPLQVSASSSQAQAQAQAQAKNAISPTSTYPNRHPAQSNFGSYQADNNLFVVSSDGMKNVHHVVSTSSYPESNQQQSLSMPTFSSELRPMQKERVPDPERVEFTERDAIHVSYTSNPMDSMSRYNEQQQHHHHQQQHQQQQERQQSYSSPTGMQEDEDEEMMQSASDVYGRVKVNANKSPPNPTVEQKDTEEYCERICSNVQDDDEEVVCGSDGYMYTSEAQMECYASCLHIDVTIQSKGTCNQSL